MDGQGVHQDYLKAKKYYEIACKYNDCNGFYNLGELYKNGYGVKQDIMKAITCYEISLKNKNFNSLFILADIFSNGYDSDVNISKSIKYFLMSIKIHYKEIFFFNNFTNDYSYQDVYNIFYYHSNNDLGLIYLIVYEDVEKANEYIKEAAFGQYPFGQNNYGLLNELYFNNIENAKYMYERSSKNNFALAEFNLGQLKEKQEKFDESIQHFLKASEIKNSNLIFRKTNHHDKRLEISNTFIMCFVNLKLTCYYFTKSIFNESKKYFIKSFENINIETHKFKFIYQKNNIKSIFSYLKSFILNFPSFNLLNQLNLSSDIKNLIKHFNNEINSEKISGYQNQENNENVSGKQNETKYLNEKINSEKISESQNKENKENTFKKHGTFTLMNTKNEDNQYEICFEDLGELFDFIIKNNDIKNIFTSEIKIIIEIMRKIIYTPPYNILFGRLKVVKPESNDRSNSKAKNINKEFYEGFGFDI